MSILGELASKVLGGTPGSQQPGIDATQASLLPAMAGLIQQLGGIEGLAAKFQQAGLGGKIAQWISTGPNPPTNAEEVQAALGSHVDDIAQQTGQDTAAVASGLSALLPGLVDRLTPDGQAPSRDDLHQGLESLLKTGLGKLLG